MNAALPLVVTAVALAVQLPAASATAPELGGGRLHGLGAVGDRAAQVPARGFTGGEVTTTNTGETLTVYVHDSYLATDPEIGQRWADFLGTLVHGPELSRLTVYLAPLERIRRACGSGALACYDGDSETVFAVGTDQPEVTAASVLAHEYAHHIANNRRNDPWPAIDYGTKRWASYTNVCGRAEHGELAPGDQGERYEVNPGEVFAEIYRLLIERRSGVAESPWDVVDRTLYPDDEELRLVEQDVVNPWTGNRSKTISGGFVRMGVDGRTYPVHAPIDGTLRVTLRSVPTLGVELRVRDRRTNAVLALNLNASRAKAVNVSVCGSDDFTVGVRRVSGYGRFTVTISKP